MRRPFASCFCLLWLALVSSACESDNAASRCYGDRDCPEGLQCLSGICAIRIADSGIIDAADSSAVDMAQDQVADGDLSTDPADAGADTALDPSADRDVVLDWVTPPDSAADPDGPPPCDDTDEICDGHDNDCDTLVDEESVCEGVDVGIRVELSWDAQPADLDLHFLNREGELGGETVDPDDCYWNNTNPEWGNPLSESDNPQFSADIRQGGGDPEVTTIKQPGNEPFRILVYYPSSSQGYRSTPVNAEIKIFFDGVLTRTLTVTPEEFPDDGYYWNVACVNYRTGTVVPLEEVTQRPDTPDPHACGGNTCESPCDCAQGHDCRLGRCTDAPVEVYCCENGRCPLTESCAFADGQPGLCGGVIDFDTDLDGNSLAIDVNVETLFARAGVTFSTSRADARVMTNPYELSSRSRGNSCATRDNALDDGEPVYWLGNVTVTFSMPGPAGSTPAATFSAGMALGQTWPYGLAVDVFDMDGALITTVFTDTLGTDTLSYESEVPIGRLNVRPAGGNWSDPDFAMDDLTFGPLFIP